MTTGSTQDRQVQNPESSPLPRRGEQPHGRIPTQYTPGSGRLRAAAKSAARNALRSGAVRVRPGAPAPLSPEPQQGAPGGSRARTATAFAIRPGTPDDATQAPDLDELTQPYAATAVRNRRVRRRTLALGAAVVLLAGGTAVALTLGGGHAARHTAAGTRHTRTAAAPTTPSSVPSAVPSAQPTPSPTLIDPLTLLSSATTDKAPISAAALFPGKNVTVNGHAYTQALTATSPCAAAASPALAGVLGKNGCQGVFRATYTGGGTVVTVGIAVFDNAAQANAVKAAASTGNISSLFGGAVKPFCQQVVCRISTNAVGRYAYFTVAGYPTGKPVPANDTVALAASNDLASLAFQNLADRGRSELPH